MSPEIHLPAHLLRRLGFAALASLCIGPMALAGPVDAPVQPDAPAGWQYAWHALRAQVPLPMAPTLVAYVADADANGIRGYEVDAGTGILTPLKSPAVPTQEYPFFVAAHPSGRFVYAANLRSNSVSGYAVDPDTGALRPLQQPAAETGALPWAIAMHPSGDFAYVLNAGSRNISTYAVDTLTGALQAAAPRIALEDSPQAIAVAPDGRFAYVAMAGRNALAGFAVDSRTGSMRRMPEATVPLEGTPESITIDGEHPVLHVLLSSGELRSYDMDPVLGRLSRVAGSVDTPSPGERPDSDGSPRGPAALAHVCARPASWVRGVAADPQGNYAFAVQGDAHAILTYRIGKSSGRCLSAVQARADGGSRPLAIVVVPLRRRPASTG